MPLSPLFAYRDASIAVVGCYFTRDPRSVNLSAKAHGRVAIVMKALELMLSVVYGLNRKFGLKTRLVSGCMRC